MASIRKPPQNLKYKGEPSRLEIGAGNTIRERVTMNLGTEGGGMVTRVCDDGTCMLGSHVAHDCQAGDHVVFGQDSAIAGHVTVGDFATLGRNAGVHRFCRIGVHPAIGDDTMVVADVVPWESVANHHAQPGKEPR